MYLLSLSFSSCTFSLLQNPQIQFSPKPFTDARCCALVTPILHRASPLQTEQASANSFLLVYSPIALFANGVENSTNTLHIQDASVHRYFVNCMRLMRSSEETGC
ncbi:hypothetical protein M9H77_23141 [Catharanthus roseus]|uniref:Uncharacterized protein n=1 Tax=Catharanthus roseus TaxID=4058 RepID=A0ACC0AWI0_CATRO|nr:hypothetical protein M9H77_23141 [Catharanthus roseus]